MSKKFTSFLVVLAALLLTVPTQAQFAKKAAKQTTVLKAGPLKVNDVQKVKAAKMKAAAKYEGQAFTSKVFNSYLQASLEKVQENKAVFEKQMEENLKETLYGNHDKFKEWNKKELASLMKSLPVAGSFATNRAEVEVVTPPAELVTEDYVVTARNYKNDADVSAPLLVGFDGNDVYIQGLCTYLPESWVKGTLSGTTVTFAYGQYFGIYGSTYEMYLNTLVGEDVVFDYDATTGALTAQNEFFLVDNDQYYFDSYRGAVLTKVVEQAATPANPQITNLQNSNYGWIVLFNVPLQDTEGNPLVASKLYYEIFTDVQEEVNPLTFTPATHSKLTESMTIIPYGFTEDYDFYATQIYLNDLYSDSWNKIGIKSIYTGGGETHESEIQWYTIKPYGEPTAETADPVDVLPYSNTLGTADEFAQFGVIDSNSDGKTWIFSADNGTYYGYSSANAADDWLISPAIKLEAGKKYHFAIDAASASTSYPEVFEVLIGTEPKASALKQSVLAATQVASKEFATYENETVEVAETGYYHFGIHAISDANMWNLFVANFLVEAGAEPTAPAAVTDFAVAQTPDVLEAIVSFKAPAKTVGGDDLTDLTQIDVLRDGAVIKSLVNVPAGSADWDASAQGYENQQKITEATLAEGITATFSKAEGKNDPAYYNSGTSVRMYAGNTMTISSNKPIKKIVFTFDTAKTPAFDVNIGAFDADTYTWTGVADNIVFSVPNVSGQQTRIKKIEIETGLTLTPGAEYTVLDNAEDLTVGTHVYQVIPYNASGAGVKSEEKSIFLSVSFEVPQTFDFTQNLLDLFGVIDNNGDGKTWSWSESNGAYYPYSSSNAADDYLITMPFKLKAGKKYNVIVTAKNSGYDEKFEVLAGKEPTVAGLTEKVIPETTISGDDEATNSVWNEYEGTFAPAEDGSYNFAIHATSDADMFNLCVKTLVVELAPEETAPAAVADFAVAAGAEGALEANLTFTAPAKAINGNALEGNVDVKIYRDNELVNTLTGVAAGSAQSWKDTNVENGKIYTYYVVAANESGDGLKSEKVSTFIGIDEVGDVANIQVTGTTANTISMSWDAVAGKNGGYVNLADVKYAVVSMHVETVWFWQVLVVDDVLATVTGQTSATFDYPCDEGEQDYKYFGVVALQGDAAAPAAGDEFAGGYTWALVGAPYELPFAESFTGGNLAYGTWAVDGCENTYGFRTGVASDDDCALAITTVDEPGLVRLESGRVNIKGVANPTLLFDAMGIGAANAKVFASKDGGDWEVIATVPVTENYSTVKVSLANVNTERFVRFAIGIDVTNPSIATGYDDNGNVVLDYGDLLLIDNIKIVDLYQYNLVADIKAPKSVVAGQKAKIVATVTNAGENPVKDYVVSITAGNKALTNVIGDKELAPFTKDIIEVDYETSIFDETGDVTLTVNVQYENELLPEDNTASAIITITEPTATAPTSLLAEDKGAAGVDLTWTVAAAGTEEVFENFTSYENGANEALGDWTLVNNNGASKGSIFNDLSLANDGLVKAWEVMKPSEYGIGNTLFNGPNGSLEEAYLISAYNLDGQSYPDNDDWLISPELPGIAQEISFAIGALDVQYGPSSYEVLVSSTDSEIASFTKVAEGTLTSAGWNSVTAQLPEGTKYFAIRNNTSGDGAMCVMLGDIKFTANSSATAASFNIYVEQVKVASVEGDKTTYTVAADKLTAGEHTFAVTAVYANGAESKPVTATITVATDIRQIAADGKPVDVYSIDGKLIRNQAKSFDGLKGLYIVNGKKIMVK